MRGFFFLLIIAVGLLVFGIQGLQEAMAFRHPVTIRYQDFVKSKPHEGWYHITGCEMDMADAVFKVTGGKSDSEKDTADSDATISEVYLPVHAPGAEAGPNTMLVLQTNDDGIRGTVKELRQLENATDAYREKWLKENLNDMFVQKDLSGMIQTGINSSPSTRQEIAKLQTTLAPNYVILEEGKSPSMASAIAMVAGGSILGIVLLFILVSKIGRLGRPGAARL